MLAAQRAWRNWTDATLALVLRLRFAAKVA